MYQHATAAQWFSPLLAERVHQSGESTNTHACAEAREYEKELPDQLYEEWYRLYSLPRPERNGPWKFMHLTLGQVYKPLARSNGKILELTTALRENSRSRYKRPHQFLSEIGVKALRTQLGQLLGIARISRSTREYEGHFQTLFGDQLMIPFPEGEGDAGA